MGEEYTAKSFKSGNSVAIRIPAALGITANREWTVTEEDGDLRLRAKEPPRKGIDVSGLRENARGSNRSREKILRSAPARSPRVRLLQMGQPTRRDPLSARYECGDLRYGRRVGPVD